MNANYEWEQMKTFNFNNSLKRYFLLDAADDSTHHIGCQVVF